MNRPPWKARRRIVHGTLLFCAAMVIWLVFKGEDTNLASAIANACFFLSGSVIGAYVFGAAWDDKNVMETMGTGAYRDDAFADPIAASGDAQFGHGPETPVGRNSSSLPGPLE